VKLERVSSAKSVDKKSSSKGKVIKSKPEPLQKKEIVQKVEKVEKVEPT
tara:strand:+ start:520 stop:666 length:147 start_codon:yes stop_codon:yes gene_type:complete